MKVLIINSVCGTGSTGRICTDLAQEFEKNGDEVKIAYGRSSYVPEKFQKYAVRIGSPLGVRINAFKSRLFDNEGLNAKRATKAFLKWVEAYNPDLIWLHNLHGYYLNYELLFRWIKSRPNLEVKWTLHDCWAFTGHCAYFSYAKCDKWQTGCGACQQKSGYPKRILKDHSKTNYERKKKSFLGVKNMTLITPSEWLKGLVQHSFFSDYPIEVRYNKVDPSVFKPTESGVKKELGLTDKKIILGVAGVWDERKGLSDFIALSKMLDDRYAILLVGVTERQIKTLPKNVIGITRTENVTKLAEIYTAADVFLNLTYEDNYPTVNLEAQSCGTPCITYRTGGSVESVPESNVVEQGDLMAVKAKIEELIE